MVSRFVVTNVIAADTASVFDLELDTEIHAESMKKSGESAVTSTGSSALELNDEVPTTWAGLNALSGRGRRTGWIVSELPLPLRGKSRCT
ncbi:MAG: hypothetical protein K0Q46_5363 [Rhodococcus erythropolis]|jgi:hypothetical protein|nr:hypothetical protein [Rhodococcus erythropolis]MDF2898577.1 hypothetical protein [Rhodococcus erythropolis]